MNDAKNKISIHPGYVLVERPQNHTVLLADQPTFLREVASVCEAASCGAVLIRGTSTKVKLSIMDVYELGKRIAGLGLQIAIVESHDASSSRVEFLESAATIRGGAIKFFDNEQHAKDWLGVS